MSRYKFNGIFLSSFIVKVGFRATEELESDVHFLFFLFVHLLTQFNVHGGVWINNLMFVHKFFICRYCGVLLIRVTKSTMSYVNALNSLSEDYRPFIH